MDWLTLTVEAVGAVIFLVWAVLPAREFREIYRALKAKGRGESAAEGPLPVVMADEGSGENSR